MKDFFQRNTPIFVIGLVTIGVFVTIIITAQKNPGPGPKLEQIKNEQFVFDYTPTVGVKNAPLTLVEFSDFECPACRAFQPTIIALRERYKNHMLFAYKQFPLPMHKNANSAAVASMAANAQGKFWEYGDALFDIQPDFSQEKYIEIAGTLGLDVEKFKKDLEDAVYAKQVEEDRSQGIRIGIDSTPTFILNGKLLKLVTFDDLEKEIKLELTRLNVNFDDVAIESTKTPPAPVKPVAKIISPQDISVDNTYGTIEITYEEDGFHPANVKAIQNQKVRWTNKTDADINVEQLIFLYEEFAKPVVIAAGGTFELRLTKDQLWTYKEQSKRHYGGIFVVALEN